MPATRFASMDVCEVALGKHRIFTLLEVDVTDARSRMKRLRAEGKRISLTGWIASCLGAAAAEYPEAHGVRAGPRGLALSREADITVLVEKALDESAAPLPFLIRGCQEKSPEAVSREIREAKESALPPRRRFQLERIYPAIPAFLRRLWWRLLLRRPEAMKTLMGTIALTSLGNYGSTRGWVVPLSLYPLCVGVGAVAEVPAVKGGKIVIREHLCLTVMLDHDVIDGAPAARFVSRLSALLEGAHGL